MNIYDRYDAALRNRYKAKVIDEHGNEVDDDEVLRDRHRVSVPMVLMDDGKGGKKPAREVLADRAQRVRDDVDRKLGFDPAADRDRPYRHADNRAGFVQLSDEDRAMRAAQIAAYDAKVSNAWRRGGD